jgi:hypothetical protein
MKWLLTTPVEIDLDGVREEVEAAGGELDPRAAVPLAGGEQVLYAQGPENLPERLAGTKLPIKVSPDSEMKAY